MNIIEVLLPAVSHVNAGAPHIYKHTHTHTRLRFTNAESHFVIGIRLSFKKINTYKERGDTVSKNVFKYHWDTMLV